MNIPIVNILHVCALTHGHCSRYLIDARLICVRRNRVETVGDSLVLVLCVQYIQRQSASRSDETLDGIMLPAFSLVSDDSFEKKGVRTLCAVTKRKILTTHRKLKEQLKTRKTIVVIDLHQRIEIQLWLFPYFLEFHFFAWRRFVHVFNDYSD